MEQQDIRDVSLEELKATLTDWGIPGYRADQIFTWLYRKGVEDFDRMTNLAPDLRQRISRHFSLSVLRSIKESRSTDGTRKFLIGLADKELIESVLIPAKDRVTGCISAQVGCRYGCRFCASGLAGFKRHLSSGEIINQVIYLKESESLSNLVVMGVGEPMDNYDNVLKALRIINSPRGVGLGARRITISTCGLIPGIKRLAGEGLQIRLSVSLHSADDKIRTGLMPVNKQYPLKELIKACQYYIRQTNRLVTFEYLLIKGVNSGVGDARQAARLLTGLNCKVNLIPYNPVAEFGFTAPGRGQVSSFCDTLVEAGIKATIRVPRGQDIRAACGQLRIKG